MPPCPPSPVTETTGYFDTPLRRERMQFFVRLVANVEVIPCLPAGAGKTCFLTGLGKYLAAKYQVVRLVAGVGVRMLLVGRGELVQAASDWGIRFVDLLPFREDELRAFLQERAGKPFEVSGVRVLHRTAGGRPGPLPDTQDGLSDASDGAAVAVRPGHPWPWILVGLLLSGLAWAGQQRINTWFEPGNESSAALAAQREEARDEAAVSPADTPIDADLSNGGGQAVTSAIETASVAVAGDLPEGAPEPVVTARSPENPEAGPAETDSVPDAIIDEAIRAAAQPPEEAAVVSQQVLSAAGQNAPGADASSKAGGVSQTAAKSRNIPQRGTAWLLAQPTDYWTLQLVGSRERAFIEAFIRRHHIAPLHAVFERMLDGRPWYSLVAGSYPSRDAAVAARARLPASIAHSGVWPRTFALIREQMQANH